MLKIAMATALLILGATLPGRAQNLVQTLTVNLTAYDTVGDRVIRIGTPQLIQYLTGTNVPGGQLLLVTPRGNPPGFQGDLDAFLRIVKGTNTVLEIPTPSQFNLLQDIAAVKTNALTYTIRAINRFSIDSGSVRAELQGFSNWIISPRLVKGVDVSGSGWFQSDVNGWIAIFNVTQPGGVPVRGSILASYPRPQR